MSVSGNLWHGPVTSGSEQFVPFNSKTSFRGQTMQKVYILAPVPQIRCILKKRFSADSQSYMDIFRINKKYNE
jgi:hypothetical protein